MTQLKEFNGVTSLQSEMLTQEELAVITGY